MNEGLFKIILAVITLLSAIVTGVVVPYIKSKTTKEQRENAMGWVRIAVGAAEQMKKAGLIEMPKKEFVFEFLTKHEIKITADQLDVMIENAVNELNEAKKELFLPLEEIREYPTEDALD